MEVRFTFKIGEKELVLTEDEARELYEKLDTMFGKQQSKEYIPYIPYPDYPWWWRKVWYYDAGEVTWKLQPYVVMGNDMNSYTYSDGDLKLSDMETTGDSVVLNADDSKFLYDFASGRNDVQLTWASSNYSISEIE